MNSFTELVKLFGNKDMARKIAMSTTFTAIEAKCGALAAVIWGFLNDQESCKRYGPNGAILHEIGSISKATGYDDSDIIGSVLTLASNGFAKFTPNGQYVRAA